MDPPPVSQLGVSSDLTILNALNLTLPSHNNRQVHPQPADCDYCDHKVTTNYPCNGKQFFGRGPLQVRTRSSRLACRSRRSLVKDGLHGDSIKPFHHCPLSQLLTYRFSIWTANRVTSRSSRTSTTASFPSRFSTTQMSSSRTPNALTTTESFLGPLPSGTHIHRHFCRRQVKGSTELSYWQLPLFHIRLRFLSPMAMYVGTGTLLPMTCWLPTPGAMPALEPPAG